MNEKSKKQELIDELKKQKGIIKKLKKNINSQSEEGHLLRTLIDTLPDRIYIKDEESRFLTTNKAHMKAMGLDKLEDVVGKQDFDFFPDKLARQYFKDEQKIIKTNKPLDNREEKEIGVSGKEAWLLTTKLPLHDKTGRTIGTMGISRDITEIKRAKEELKKHRDHLEELVSERTSSLEEMNKKLRAEIEDGKRRETIIKKQSQEIMELSTPVMEIWQGVVIAPLIGTLDSQRTQQFMDKLLHAIVEKDSATAIVDITGVPVVDTVTAQHLLEAIGAAKLLGTRVLLTGVRPIIAQTLVHLGVDLSEVSTYSSLSAGLKDVFDSKTTV